MIKTHTTENPGLRFGNYDPTAEYPRQSERTQAFLAKLMVSAHEGAVSLAGAWPNIHTNSFSRRKSMVTISRLMDDGGKWPTLGNRQLTEVCVTHEHENGRFTSGNTTRFSVLVDMYNHGPATTFSPGTSVALGLQIGKGFDTSVSGEGPLRGQRSPQAHILGVVAATQALRDGVAGAGGELTTENAIDYAEVRGVLADWEHVIPGHLDPLLVRMQEHGYDISRLTPSPEVSAVV